MVFRRNRVGARPRIETRSRTVSGIGGAMLGIKLSLFTAVPGTLACSAWGALAVLICFAASAVADGKAFPFLLYDPTSITMPDQRAIIAWDEGVQTLAIETTIVGAEGETAWIIPLPAVPEIEAGTPGLFPTVQRVFADPVVHPRFALIDLFLWFTLPIAMMAVAHQCRSPIGRVVRGVAFTLAILMLLYPILAPTLGTARAALGEPGVHVVARDHIGGFDVATLRATDGDDLLGWLAFNGFAHDPSIEPVVADYLAQEWVFVAVKLAVPSGSDPGVNAMPMPLVFRFETDQPVYPMRLTGVQNGPLEVELFVFGEGRAWAPGLAVRTCAETIAPEFDESGDAEGISVRYGYEGPELVIAHPGLKGIVGDLPVGTHLAGTLAPEQMTEDLAIGWSGFRQTRRFVHSEASMDQQTWRWGGVALLAALVVGFAIRQQIDRARWYFILPAVLAPGVLGAAGPRVLLERLEVDGLVSSPRRFRTWTHREIAAAVFYSLVAGECTELYVDVDLVRSPAEEDLPWASRVALAVHSSEAFVSRFGDPLFPMTDAPLGYTIRQNAEIDRLEYVWYGAYGQEIVIPLEHEKPAGSAD
jgi:hypothetical protein